MEVIKTGIEGVVIIQPRLFHDSRGYFFESFNLKQFSEAVCPVNFVQDNESASTMGVVRGLHFQKPPYSQSKLVRCIEGEVLDVALDLRKDSPSYGKHVSVILSAENHTQLFIPRGFAHGFSVLSQRAVFQYKCDNFYEPSSEGGILLTDPSLSIDWKIPAEQMILSDKDTHHPFLDEFESPFTLENCAL